MEQKRTTWKGTPDGIKTLPQILAYFGIVRACRHVPALIARTPVVISLVIPKGQDELYKHVCVLIIGQGRWDRSDGAVLVTDSDPRKRKRNEEDIAEAIRNCDRVVVLTESRELLPQRFEAVADAVVDVPVASARDIAAAARILLDMRLPAPDAELAASACPDILAAAFRKGRPLAVAMRVLRDAMAVETTSRKEPAGPTLDDLYGLGEAGDWGRELATDLADWKAGRISWADVERGILLSGPPGTGKTTFAAALARTCGVDVVLTSHARWQAAGHLGDTLKAMRKSFDDARNKAPCILFIDEVDSIGKMPDYDDEYDIVVHVIDAILDNEGSHDPGAFLIWADALHAIETYAHDDWLASRDIYPADTDWDAVDAAVAEALRLLCLPRGVVLVNADDGNVGGFGTDDISARARIDTANKTPLRWEGAEKSRFDDMSFLPGAKPVGRYLAYEAPLDDWEADDGWRVSDLGPLVGCWFTYDPEYHTA